MKYDFDMIVIGGGAAGLTASGMSALLGAKTALVESNRLGGDCTWNGCVPSKSLLRAAHAAHALRTADAFGIEAVTPRVDFGRVMHRVRAIRQGIYEEADAPPNFERLAVEVISARARFTGTHTLELHENGTARRVTSRFFVISTGSAPKAPSFAAPTLNNESLFELTEQPARLLVLGGGPVGIEMSQAFSRLGTKVTVAAPGQGILRKDDSQLSAMLQASLAREGVVFRMSTRVNAVERAGAGLLAHLESGESMETDAVLAAIGREPRIEGLGLEQAGVAFTPKGITVDRRCRTSQRHIFASGDVTGRYQFTHMAEHMSKIAVTNAILRIPKSLDEAGVSWCTFTDPELAHVGQTEEGLRSAGTAHQVYRFPFGKLDRAITESEPVGLVKVMANKKGRILGASILGARAGEMIAEFSLAMRGKLKLATIAETIHAYPTYTLGNRRAADAWFNKQLDTPLLAVLGSLLGYRGERRGSSVL